MSTRRRPRWLSLRVTAFGLTACALGLLLWSRLILVTNHPRTAIAEPAPAGVEHVSKPSKEGEHARDKAKVEQASAEHEASGGE